MVYLITKMCGCPLQHTFTVQKHPGSPVLALSLDVVSKKTKISITAFGKCHAARAVIYLVNTMPQSWLCNDTCVLCEQSFWSSATSLYNTQTNASAEVHNPLALRSKITLLWNNSWCHYQNGTSLLKVSLSYKQANKAHMCPSN